PPHSRSMAGACIFMLTFSRVPWLFFLSLLCAILGIAPVGFDRNSATFYSALPPSWFLLLAPIRYYGSSFHPLGCFGLRHFEPYYSHSSSPTGFPRERSWTSASFCGARYLMEFSPLTCSPFTERFGGWSSRSQPLFFIQLITLLLTLPRLWSVLS